MCARGKTSSKKGNKVKNKRMKKGTKKYYQSGKLSNGQAQRATVVTQCNNNTECEKK